MKRTLTVALVVLVVAAGMSGLSVAQDSEASSTQDIDELVEVYNSNLEEAPGFVTGQLAGKDVEIAVDRTDGETKHYHATLADDARITDYGEGEAEDPDVRVTTDSETLDAIQSADNPSDRAVEAYESGDISVRGVGAVNSVQVTAVEAGVAVGKFLGLL